MRFVSRRRTAAGIGVLAAVIGARSGHAQSPSGTGSAKIDTPKALTVPTGFCRKLDNGTFGAFFGPEKLPPLAFTIGPGAAMADEMHASKAPFTGPGRYKDVIVMVYLGKTALEDTYGGLGTVAVNGDGRSGSFVLNDGRASGTWNCGGPAR